MPNILITGGAGFIGHRVAEILSDQGHSVISLDSFDLYGSNIPIRQRYLHARARIGTEVAEGDINTGDIHNLIEDRVPETVIHLASFPRQAYVTKEPLAASKTMVKGLLNTLAACEAYGVKRFVFISSSMVYGDFSEPVSEDAPLRPVGLYGILKRAGEEMVQDWAKRTGREVVIVRPSAAYGPTEMYDRVITRFFHNAIAGRELIVNGSGEILDFTFLDDVAGGIALAATVDKAAGNAYNITYGEGRLIKEAAEIIVGLVGKGTVVAAERQDHFPSRNALRIDKAREELGYTPQYSLELGLKAYWQWLKSKL